MLRLFELPYDEDPLRNSNHFKDYGTAVYLTIITFTSVGYGDFHAHTSCGQFVSMFIAFWGTFVMSLIIMVVSNIFDFTPDEKKAVFFIKQTRSSAHSITLALKFWLSKKKWYK